MRAVEFQFLPVTQYDGIACKFSGTAANLKCVDTTLRSGKHVNMFTPNPLLAREMIRKYWNDPNCSFTIDNGVSSVR
jgi:hypothetical protein